MAIYRRIPTKYLRLIPAVCFMLLGAYDIISDLLDHKLIPFNLFFNLAFIVPLFISSRYVSLVCGILFGALSGYALVALIIYFLLYLGGTHMREPFEMFVLVIPFSAFFLLCSISLTYVGYTAIKARQLQNNRS